MSIQDEDFMIEVFPDTKTVIIKGTMRLNSPIAYENHFSGLTNLVQSEKTITIDIRDLEFLNSSGLTSLGRVFMLAKKTGIKGTLIARNSIPWHSRSITSIAKLWPNLTIEMI